MWVGKRLGEFKDKSIIQPEKQNVKRMKRSSETS